MEGSSHDLGWGVSVPKNGEAAETRAVPVDPRPDTLRKSRIAVLVEPIGTLFSCLSALRFSSQLPLS